MTNLSKWFATALLGLALAGAFERPARAGADINACFDMVTDAVNTVVHVVDNVTAFAADPQCSAIAGSSTLMFGIVTGIVTAVNISGAFGGHDYASCAGAINNAIASAIVAALSAALDDGSPLGAIIPDDARDPIKTIAVNLATDPAVINQINDWLSALPVIGQMIGMMPCACRLSAAVVQAANDVVQTVKSAAECGEALLNCVSSPVQCAGALFESGIEAIEDAAEAVAEFICGLFGSCPKPPPPMPTFVDCMGGATLSGQVEDRFLGYSEAKWSKTTNQWCMCAGEQKWISDSGVWSCGCEGANEVPSGTGLCNCAPGLSRKDFFAGDRTCKPCPEGSQPGSMDLGCDCLKEGATLTAVRGVEVCRCPPHLRDVAGKCVTPCGPGQVLTGLGACCKANQVSACGQCCSAPNCADERMPAAGTGISCCPPGQINAAGGCGRPRQITRAGEVCALTKVVSDDRLDCTRPVRIMRHPPPAASWSSDSARVRNPASGPATARRPATTTRAGTVLDRHDLGPNFVSPDVTTSPRATRRAGSGAGGSTRTWAPAGASTGGTRTWAPGVKQ